MECGRGLEAVINLSKNDWLCLRPLDYLLLWTVIGDLCRRLVNPSEISSVSVERVTTLNIYIQGWVFAMAKSIFARTVEKNGNNRQMEQKKPCQCHLYKAMKNLGYLTVRWNTSFHTKVSETRRHWTDCWHTGGGVCGRSLAVLMWLD